MILREMSIVRTLIDFASEVIKILYISTDPLDFVFDSLHDQINPLKHVRDVIYSPLLYLQLQCSNIQVNLLIW